MSEIISALSALGILVPLQVFIGVILAATAFTFIIKRI